MRKILLTALVTIGMIGSSLGQLAIPGEVFAQNPARFNGRKVTIKNIQLVSENLNGGNGMIGPVGTVSGPVSVGAPGAIGTPSAPNVTPCNPPRGFSKVGIFFKGEPEYKGCFFMADAMFTQLNRELGGHDVDAMISFRGDARTGYVVSFYRLGM